MGKSSLSNMIPNTANSQESVAEVFLLLSASIASRISRTYFMPDGPSNCCPSAFNRSAYLATWSCSFCNSNPGMFALDWPACQETSTSGRTYSYQYQNSRKFLKIPKQVCYNELQSTTLSKAPQTQAPFIIDLSISTQLSSAFSVDGQQIEFSASCAGIVLRYGNVHVFDKDGNLLAARLDFVW